MKIENNSRVHVVRMNKKDVDFYATLEENKAVSNMFLLTDCTDEEYESEFIYKHTAICFGKNRTDYYVLAADEEDSEPVEIIKADDQASKQSTKKVSIVKEMNLPELIEWASKKDIKDEKFYSKNGCHISIDFRGHVFLWDIRLNEIFTVEVEEEITESTLLPNSVVLFRQNGNWHTEYHNSKSINEILELDKKVSTSITKTIYLLNFDGTLNLVWQNGKLVQ